MPGRDYASYLDHIYYNWDGFGFQTLVTFERASREQSGLHDFRVYAQVLFCQTYYLSAINIQNWDGGAHRTIREYVLNYTHYDPPPEGNPHHNNTRLLASITEYGLDGAAGGSALPATTFQYSSGNSMTFNKKGCQDGEFGCNEGDVAWNKEHFRYERLRHIDNGYGGVVNVAYETPDYGWEHSYNYRVVSKDVDDGQGGGQKIAYTYAPGVGDRGYDDDPTYGCEYFEPGQDTGGSLVGYRYVRDAEEHFGHHSLRHRARVQAE
jgi:hypothetical protein